MFLQRVVGAIPRAVSAKFGPGPLPLGKAGASGPLIDPLQGFLEDELGRSESLRRELRELSMGPDRTIVRVSVPADLGVVTEYGEPCTEVSLTWAGGAQLEFCPEGGEYSETGVSIRGGLSESSEANEPEFLRELMRRFSEELRERLAAHRAAAPQRNAFVARHAGWLTELAANDRALARLEETPSVDLGERFLRVPESGRGNVETLKLWVRSELWFWVQSEPRESGALALALRDFTAENQPDWIVLSGSVEEQLVRLFQWNVDQVELLDEVLDELKTAVCRAVDENRRYLDVSEL